MKPPPAGRLIGQSAELAEGGLGLLFEYAPGQACFAVRYQGRVHGWVNCCPHQGSPLDWEPGDFFDAAGQLLVCATHGARFDPATGLCVSGPCRGARLRPVGVREEGGEIRLQEGGD